MLLVIIEYASQLYTPSTSSSHFWTHGTERPLRAHLAREPPRFIIITKNIPSRSFVFRSTHPLFSSKSLQPDVRRGNKAPYPRTKPRQTLALVRTCHRVRDEIGDSWIGQIHFTFKKPEAMLDMLTALPVVTLSKLRHVRVAAKDFMTVPLPGGAEVAVLIRSRYRTPPPGSCMQATKFWTSISRKAAPGRNFSISAANQHSLDFRSFRLYAMHSQRTGSVRSMDARDGVETKPSVTIYRSTLCGVPGSVLDPNTRVLFEQNMLGDCIDGLPPGTEEDEALTKEGERGKEMMVVFQRGLGVDYEEKEGSPLLKKDIRRNAPGMTCKDIRRINMEAGFPRGDHSIYSQYKWESEEED